MATTDVISAIEQSHKALGAIVKGDPTVFRSGSEQPAAHHGR